MKRPKVVRLEKRFSFQKFWNDYHRGQILLNGLLLEMDRAISEEAKKNLIHPKIQAAVNRAKEELNDVSVDIDISQKELNVMLGFPADHHEKETR